MWSILGREMTPYAVSIWIAGILALGVFLWQGRRLKTAALAWTAGLGIALGLLGARGYYVLARLDYFLEIGLDQFFVSAEEERFWGSASGAAFWGAVGGVCLGALIAGMITKEKVSALLDALAPAAALGIAVSRFGENSIGEGIGPEVTEEGLQFFPLAVTNEWGEWNYALFLLEGLVGLVIFALLITAGRRYRDGYRARMFLILYSSAQLVLEALRRDNFLRWLFVRVSQVASALVLLGLVIAGLIRWARKRKAGGGAGRLAGRTALYLLGMLAALFAAQTLYRLLILGQPLAEEGTPVSLGTLWWGLIVDGWPLTLAALAGLFAILTAQKAGQDGMTEKQAAMKAAVFLIPAVIMIAMEFGIDKSANLPEALGYLTEAVCCCVMGTAAWQIAMKN